MAEQRIIYICPECFTMAEDPQAGCEHKMLRVDAGDPGDQRSKPLMDAEGNLKTRAPVWWVERYAWWARDSQ